MAVVCVILFFLIRTGSGYFSEKDGENGIQETTEDISGQPDEGVVQNRVKKSIYVEGLSFQRISARQINVCWNGISDPKVTSYRLERRDFYDGQPVGEWITVAQADAGDAAADRYSAIDELDTAKPVQYEYRVMPEPADPEQYEAVEKETVLASNVMICIDPGHYSGKNASPEDSPYAYTEGDFTIGVAIRLKEILLEEYGIESYLTREGPSITLSGYTDIELDQKNLSLRGEYAAVNDSTLFLSIHTNANRDHANGYPTWEQPAAITKTIIIANIPAMASEEALRIGNAIGVCVSRINYEYGISVMPDFDETDPETIPGWTNEANDRLNTAGTLFCRIKDGTDVYGVLRGAGNVEVPGLIVEHAFHTVPEFRKLAAEGDLQEAYARADARGIAYGCGFLSEN